MAPTAALAASALPALMPAAGQFVAVSPIHVLDTRDGTGGVAVSPLSANSTVSVPVLGIGQVPSSGVSDVYVVINAINPSVSGCLRDYDADLADPRICTVSFQAGINMTDSDIVQVGGAGFISVTNASSGTADVAVTVMGYYQTGDAQSAGETYVPLPVKQIVDTRSGLGAPQAQIPADGSLTVQVTGVGGVPSDAAGAALFIGAANGSASGSVSAYPTGGTVSSLAALSYSHARTVHDLYFGSLSSNGQLTLVNHGSAAVDLLVAVQGYLVNPTAPEAGAAYQDVPESGIVDTRSGNGGVPISPVAPGASITFAATGTDGIPVVGTASVAESVAALNATKNGFLSVYPADGVDPGEPGVNFNGGDNQNNDLSAPVLSAVSPTGRETITNHSSGTVDVVVSARGYYTTASPPGSPQLVDSGIQDGAATINWVAPATDGGAAITSYQITVYNPDGSVNQIGSLGPDATTSTAVGLTGTGTYMVAVAAANSVGTNASAPVGINVIPSGWSTPATESTSYQTDMQVDLSSGNITLASASTDDQMFSPDGNLISSTTTDPADTSGLWTGASPSIGTFDCIIKTGGPTAHTPWHETWNSSYGVGDFMHEAYTAKNARQLVGSNGKYWTFQDMICSTGGSESKNNTHTWFSGTSVTIARTREVKIGQNWGTGASGSSVKANLNFQLAAGPATIGASVTITPGQGTYGGDIGADGRFSNYPSSWQPYWKNRVNAFFVSPHNWPWDGTTAFEGNDMEVLYEWPMGSTGSTHIDSKSFQEVFCPIDLC